MWSGREDGGHHLFYKRPAGELTSTRLRKLCPGVDLKDGGKGYTIIPPSLHPDTGLPYRFEVRPIVSMTEALFKLLHWEEPVAKWPATPSETRLAGLLRTMVNAKELSRNTTLHWVGCRLAEANYPQSAWDALTQAALAVGLPGREIQSTLRSARRTATGEVL